MPKIGPLILKKPQKDREKIPLAPWGANSDRKLLQ